MFDDDDDDFGTYGEDGDVELDENGLPSDLITEDGEEDDEEENDGEEGGRYSGRQGEVAKKKNKYIDNLGKKTTKTIEKTFQRPTSHIPDDVKESLKKSAEGIKDSSQEIMEDDFLKPHEKASAIKDAALSGTKVASKKIASETGKKAAREFLKNVIKAAAPWSYAIIAGIAVFVLIFIILLAIMVACSGGAAAEEGATEAENMTESYSITSEYFYGTRSVYIDDTALANALQQSYKQYVIDVITEIETDNPSIDIAIELPAMDDENPFTNATEVDINITNMSLGIANIVATGSDTYSGVDFASLYPQITYFGLTEDQVADTNDFLTSYFSDNTGLITIPDDSDKTIDSLIDEAIADQNLQYIYNRCEKVMIKDEIAIENGLTGIEQRKYIASIYMPNTDLYIADHSICVTTVNTDKPVSFECIIENNGTSSTLASGTTDSEDGKSQVDPIDDDNVQLSAFTSINTENPALFSTGISLLEAIRLVGDANYFAQTEDGVYTWKPVDANILYLTFDSDSEFIFTDLTMNVSTTSN